MKFFKVICSMILLGMIGLVSISSIACPCTGDNTPCSGKDGKRGCQKN